MPDTFCQPLPPRGCSGDGPDAVRRVEWGCVWGFAKFGVVVKGMVVGCCEGGKGCGDVPERLWVPVGHREMRVSLGWQRMGCGVLPQPWGLPLAAAWGVMGVQDLPPTPTHAHAVPIPGMGSGTPSLPRFPSCEEKGVQPSTENPSALQPVLP